MATSAKETQRLARKLLDLAAKADLEKARVLVRAARRGGGSPVASVVAALAAARIATAPEDAAAQTPDIIAADTLEDILAIANVCVTTVRTDADDHAAHGFGTAHDGAVLDGPLAAPDWFVTAHHDHGYEGGHAATLHAHASPDHQHGTNHESAMGHASHDAHHAPTQHAAMTQAAGAGRMHGAHGSVSDHGPCKPGPDATHGNHEARHVHGSFGDHGDHQVFSGGERHHHAPQLASAERAADVHGDHAVEAVAIDDLFETTPDTEDAPQAASLMWDPASLEADLAQPLPTL